MQAQALANGTILVRAPLSVMAGIEQLVKQMEKMPSAPKRVVHLDYWLVVGEAATSPDPGVAGVLAGAFAAIDKVDGPRRFRVLEHLASNSASGEEVRVKGISAESLATALVNDQDVSVKLDFQSRLGQVRSTTVVKPGQVLVLGQTAVAADTASDREKIAKAPANVYYVIRASLVE